MKKKSGFFIVFILLLCSFFADVSFSETCERVLLKSSAGNWKPYFYRNSTGNLFGMDVEILNGIFDLANCDYASMELPSKRGMIYIAKGRVDFIMAASITEERKKIGNFTVAYRPEVIVITMRKGYASKYNIQKMEDMISHKMRIVVSRGGWYGKEFKELEKREEFKRLVLRNDSLKQRLKMLTTDRADCVIDDKYSILFTSREMGIGNQIEFDEYIVNEDTVHILFSKKSVKKKVFDHMNQAVKDFVKTEAYKNIIKKYEKW